MKRKLKRAAIGLLTALMLISAMAMPVSAASKSSNELYTSIGGEDGTWWARKEKDGIGYNTQKVILTYYPNDKEYTDLYLDSYLWGGSIKLLKVQKNQYNVASYEDCSSLKTSDPSVATVMVKSENIIVKPKKAGTTTITFEEKYENDDGVEEVEKYTLKVTVKNYENPFKSLEIAGKKVTAKKLKKNSVCTLSYKSLKNKKTKVSYKLKNGWKITEKSWFKLKKTYQTNKSVKKITGGKGFTFKFELKNTITGQVEDVEVVLK